MTIFGLLLFLIIAGVVISMFTIEATIKKLIIGLVVIVAIVWLFAALGLVNSPVFVR